MPLAILNNWIEEEKQAGAINPQQAILSTATVNAIPHARVVAIREISSDQGLLFFTQKETKKVTELTQNPLAAMTFWFELYQREVMIEGTVIALSDEENESYWRSYPRTAQIRFCAYAPTSAQPITGKELLENKRIRIAEEFNGKQIPMSPHYCGFRLKPTKFIFYTFRTDELSDVVEYQVKEGHWSVQLLSP
jgi:pyridoxamine 5'-phosphate oxidase